MFKKKPLVKFKHKLYMFFNFFFFSDQNNSKILSYSKHNSFDSNEYKMFENKSNKIGKNIKATFTVKAHHHKCGHSKLNQSTYVYFELLIVINLEVQHFFFNFKKKAVQTIL